MPAHMSGWASATSQAALPPCACPARNTRSLSMENRRQASRTAPSTTACSRALNSYPAWSARAHAGAITITPWRVACPARMPSCPGMPAHHSTCDSGVMPPACRATIAG